MELNYSSVALILLISFIGAFVGELKRNFDPEKNSISIIKFAVAFSSSWFLSIVVTIMLITMLINKATLLLNAGEKKIVALCIAAITGFGGSVTTSKVITILPIFLSSADNKINKNDEISKKLKDALSELDSEK